MAGAIELAEAAQALIEQFGSQIEGIHDEGRRLMADALATRFGVSRREAGRLVEALEHAGTIRWITGPLLTVQANALAVETGHWQLRPM